MKTIDEIISRQDYQNLNNALNDRVKEIAEVIRKKMYDLQITELGDYRISGVKSNSGYSTEYLAILDEYADRSLEADGSYYYCNDFNCHIYAASYKQKLYFLNSCRDLFDMLYDTETEKCHEIEKALEQSNDLTK